MEWNNLVPGAVDHEGWSGISTVAEVGEGRDSGSEVRRRRRQPGSIVGSNAIEEERQTVTLLEEGKDKLRAWVPWTNPTEVVALVPSGLVGCYLT